MNSNSQHVYPVVAEPDHDTNGLDCWCSPRYLLPCDECDAGCWKCVDGTIEITRAEAGETPRSIIIVHNR